MDARVVFYLDSGASIICIFKGDIGRLWDEAAERVKAEFGTHVQGKVLVFEEKHKMTIAELRERMHAMIGRSDGSEVVVSVIDGDGKEMAGSDLTVTPPGAPDMPWLVQVSVLTPIP